MRAGVILLLLAAIIAVSPSRAQTPSDSPGTVPFKGLPHRAVADASINSALVIRDLGPTGKDGVRVDLGEGVRHWTAEMRGVPNTLDFAKTVTVMGRDDGGRSRSISSLEIREVSLPDGFALAFSPTFDSPTYRVEIFHESTRVLDLTGLRAGTVVFSGNDPICDALGKANSVALGFCEFVWSDCHFLDDDGRSGWIIDRVAPVTWVVPLSGRSVVGDKIRLTQEKAPSEPPVDLTEVMIQASNLSELIIFEEQARSTVEHY